MYLEANFDIITVLTHALPESQIYHFKLVGFNVWAHQKTRERNKEAHEAVDVEDVHSVRILDDESTSYSTENATDSKQLPRVSLQILAAVF